MSRIDQYERRAASKRLEAVHIAGRKPTAHRLLIRLVAVACWLGSGKPTDVWAQVVSVKVQLARESNADDQSPFCLCPQDELWSVSTRQLSACRPCYQCIHCRQLQGCRWQRLPIEQLIGTHAADLQRLTIIYIHGNRTDFEWAMTRGKQVYQRVFGCCADRPPVRFVIWHWPADPSKRFIKDFRDNASQSVVEGRHLAWLLNQTDPHQPIGLIGYSLGAQVVFTGLECAAPAEADAVSNRRIAIIAAATNCGWPDGCQQKKVVKQFEQMVVINNCSDRALRAYRLACDHRNRALGESGMKGVAALKRDGADIKQFDVSSMVGPKHSIANYVAPVFVQQKVREAMFSFDPADTPAPGPPEDTEILDGHFD